MLARPSRCAAQRDASLAGFEVFHFRGHWFERGIEIAEAIRAVVADPHLPIWSLPWWLIGRRRLLCR
jgi:hypothetical protein